MKCTQCNQPKKDHKKTDRGLQCKLYGNFYFTAPSNKSAN